MALPAHLSRFDSLLDLMADVIAREIEEGAQNKTPAGMALQAGVKQHHERERIDGRTRVAARATP